MRHMSQKSVPLLCQIDQASPQPFQLPSEPLKVDRAPHLDRIRERPTPELADRPIKLPQGPSDGERKPEDRNQRDRQEERRLPHEAPPRFVSLLLERNDLRVDLRIALFSGPIGESAQISKALQQLRKTVRRLRHAVHHLAYGLLQLPKLSERVTRLVGAHLVAKLNAGGGQTR